MHLSKLRLIIVTLATMLTAGHSLARAGDGVVRISFVKAGWIIGGSVGSGALTFHGRTYRLSVGGLSDGFTFGGSQTNLHGQVSNIYRPLDIEGASGAGSAGAAVIRGPQAIVLTNQKGAVLELSGSQTGLILTST